MVQWLWNQFCGLQQFCEVLHFYKMGLSRKYQNVSHIVIITIFLEPCLCYMCIFTYVHKTVWFGLQYKINFLLWVVDMKKCEKDWAAWSFHVWFEKPFCHMSGFHMWIYWYMGSLFCSSVWVWPRPGTTLLHSSGFREVCKLLGWGFLPWSS